jgi:hypothetical protein
MECECRPNQAPTKGVPVMWMGLLEIAIKLVAYFLGKNEVDTKVKKNYFEWIEMVGNNINSVKLMEYGSKQKNWFDTNEFKET